MTRGLIDSSSAASFWTQFDIFSASTSACRSISSSGMPVGGIFTIALWSRRPPVVGTSRSEEHTSDLQSRGHLVCRLLLEKTKSDLTQDLRPFEKLSIVLRQSLLNDE